MMKPEEMCFINGVFLCSLHNSGKIVASVRDKWTPVQLSRSPGVFTYLHLPQKTFLSGVSSILPDRLCKQMATLSGAAG